MSDESHSSNSDGDTSSDHGGGDTSHDHASHDHASHDHGPHDHGPHGHPPSGHGATDGAVDAAPDEPGARAGKPTTSKAGAPKSAPRSAPDDSLGANVRTFLFALAIALGIRVAVFEPFKIEGPSMEPTLLNGDQIIVAKYPFGLFLPGSNEAVVSWGMPNPGDVVIVHSPADNVDIVKRVIGVAGDRISIHEGVVMRNGESIRRRVLGPCRADETSEGVDTCQWVEEGIGDHVWRTSHSLFSGNDSLLEQTVPEGAIFVLGDHRDRSNDSRNPAVGMVPIGRVKGRASVIYFSQDDQLRQSRIFTSVR